MQPWAACQLHSRSGSAGAGAAALLRARSPWALGVTRARGGRALLLRGLHPASEQG